tara:strand:+ start:507 stop:641 length:135 start_codon:yes stop_codon:yes gene_type:complete
VNATVKEVVWAIVIVQIALVETNSNLQKKYTKIEGNIKRTIVLI